MRNAHPPKTTIWPHAQAYGRVLGGVTFLWARYPCTYEVLARMSRQGCVEFITQNVFIDQIQKVNPPTKWSIYF